MTVNCSECLCRGLNAKSAPDKWLRAPNRSGSVGPKYTERSKNTEKLPKVEYQCLEWTHAHQRIHDIFHASRLMPYKENKVYGPNYPKPAPDLIKGQEEFEVKAIVGA